MKNDKGKTQMKRLSFWIALLTIRLVFPVFAQEADSTALTKVGQVPPGFSTVTLDGKNFNLSGCNGKVVLLNFFATWCPACKEELPDLQKNVWERFREVGLIVLAVGREHSREELEVFRKEGGYTFDFAPDPKREIFKLYATKNIPRNVLIGKDGKIAYQSLGYQPETFKELVNQIFQALKR
jgi:peroxiredoxin